MHARHRDLHARLAVGGVALTPMRALAAIKQCSSNAQRTGRMLLPSHGVPAHRRRARSAEYPAAIVSLWEHSSRESRLAGGILVGTMRGWRDAPRAQCRHESGIGHVTGRRSTWTMFAHNTANAEVGGPSRAARHAKFLRARPNRARNVHRGVARGVAWPEDVRDTTTSVVQPEGLDTHRDARHFYQCTRGRAPSSVNRFRVPRRRKVRASDYEPSRYRDLREAIAARAFTYRAKRNAPRRLRRRAGGERAHTAGARFGSAGSSIAISRDSQARVAE